MARFSASATKTSGAAAAWLFQIRQTSAARSLSVVEVGVFTTTAVAATFTLERAATVGATFTTTLAGQAEDPLVGAAGGTIDTAITTAPTRAGTPIPFRQMGTTAAAGGGAIWTFPGDGLTVAASSGLLIYQTSAAAVGYAMYAIWDE